MNNTMQQQSSPFGSTGDFDGVGASVIPKGGGVLGMSAFAGEMPSHRERRHLHAEGDHRLTMSLEVRGSPRNRDVPSADVPSE